MATFISAYEAITSLDLAQIFINHVFSKHGLPESTVSNRRSLFFSTFWTQLCQQLKISRDLSTAFHPKTDGQTERVNQILERYLQKYVSYHQDDWNTLLPLAEFSYNNAEHSSTKLSTFFTICGRNPSFDSIRISEDTPAGKSSTKLQSVQQVVKEELESTKKRFKKYSDRNRTTPPDFQPGNIVWLASKNVNTTRTINNFSERWLGPFEVLKKAARYPYHLKLTFELEVSSPCLPCVITRTSQEVKYPKSKSIASTANPSGGARRMGSGSGSGLKSQELNYGIL
ncbi:hypothetical protein O181_076702 [Austropuccinia psidii MF-1]|uniref:Integrase catalytic domain-containing protein n=1 Tax=Austropuccinia psidii MF-1 TaxID=1389203 RepID=A0A9Q3FHD1_9BASI|nr:hypothetical protein [Austropuccinia psidii MF-1]